jgi:hypothetical protein
LSKQLLPADQRKKEACINKSANSALISDKKF